MDLRSGGPFRTQIGACDGEFRPHLDGCFLGIDDLERIVFTNALVDGWRPAQDPFMTAVITMRDHPLGTEYTAHVMHRNANDRKVHEELGFYAGWGTVTAQLATHAEHQAEQAAGDAVVRGDRRFTPVRSPHLCQLREGLAEHHRPG